MPSTLQAEWIRQAIEQAYPSRWARRVDIVPDDWQRSLLDTEARNVIVNCSRQVGKTTTISLKAAHHGATTPRGLIIATAPSERQSKELLRQTKNFIHQTSDVRLEKDNETHIEFDNGTRMFALPGSEKTIRGFAGVTMLIIDEASRVRDELYNSVRPMLAVSGGQTILASTPFGKRGFFYREWEDGGDYWERYTVKATDCPRIPQDWLEQEKQRIGEWWFAQEYMCEFLDAEDAVFSWEHIVDAFDDAPVLFDGLGGSDVIEPLFGA